MSRSVGLAALVLLAGCAEKSPWLPAGRSFADGLRLDLPARYRVDAARSTTVVVLPACSSCSAKTIAAEKLRILAKRANVILIMGDRQNGLGHYNAMLAGVKTPVLFESETTTVSPLLERYAFQLHEIGPSGKVLQIKG
jgi:hypothetical protein